MSVPEASRLTWLEEKDVAGRSAWVSQYREGNDPSSGEGSNRTWHHSDDKQVEATQAEPSVPSEVTTGSGQESEPLMADIMSGLNYPLAKGFEMAGRRILAIDHSFANSLHWHTPTEVGMFKQGTWWDTRYDACALQGARRKKQCIRHDIEEIRVWQDTRCRHGHHPQEWTPQASEDGRTWYPSEEEAEYTACLVFHVAYSASTWACRVSRAKLAIPRQPPVECTETDVNGSRSMLGPLGVRQ